MYKSRGQVNQHVITSSSGLEDSAERESYGGTLHTVYLRRIQSVWKYAIENFHTQALNWDDPWVLKYL